MSGRPPGSRSRDGGPAGAADIAGIPSPVAPAPRPGREPDRAPLPHEVVRFAHGSEREFAKLLDFYGVVWEYEPRTFALARDATGATTGAFTPDFYLPAFGVYLELTTLQQRLVTRKNRKVRRLRELYPEVVVRVLYQRDYLHLLGKYGLEPLRPPGHLQARADP